MTYRKKRFYTSFCFLSEFLELSTVPVLIREFIVLLVIVGLYRWIEGLLVDLLSLDRNQALDPTHQPKQILKKFNNIFDWWLQNFRLISSIKSPRRLNNRCARSSSDALVVQVLGHPSGLNIRQAYSLSVHHICFVARPAVLNDREPTDPYHATYFCAFLKKALIFAYAYPATVVPFHILDLSLF